MEIKAKVVKFGSGRKFVEIPVSVRDNFRPGQEVIFELGKNVKLKLRKNNNIVKKAV